MILCHTCREVAEQAFGKALVASLRDDPIAGDHADQFTHDATTNREDDPFRGRQTEMMASGKLFADLDVPPISPEHDRGLICGSRDMLRDIKAALEGFNLIDGSNNKPGTFVVERAFVD